MRKGSALCVYRLRARADVGVREDIQTLRIRRHECVFNGVVNHFREVSRASWTAMQVPLVRRAIPYTAPRRHGRRPDARSERLKDGLETRNNRRLAADHQAVASLHATDAAADTDIDVMNALGS